MNQPNSEKEKKQTWDKSSNIEFFKRQINNPYDSTKKFFSFIAKNVDLNNSTTLLDACSGSGSAAIYAVKNFKCKNITCFDFQETYLNIGRDFLKGKDLEKKINFVNGDIYKLEKNILQGNFDGIICLASLSWINHWDLALTELAKVNTSWIALSALFYEGLIDAKIQIREHDSNGKILHQSPYNVLSLPLVKNHLSSLGFKEFVFEKFEISMDLPKKNINKMGTHTQLMGNKKRIMISGPIMQPWHFLLAKK